MKGFLFFATSVAFTAGVVAFTKQQQQIQSSLNVDASKNKNIIRCSADWEALKDWLDASDIPPMPGAGVYQWKISTKSDSAQFYFNQGINMYYGFHIIEAMASFKKAAKFDDSCAMIYWAQALTYGPNINDYGYRASPQALEALKIAQHFVIKATVFEKAFKGADEKINSSVM